MLSLNNEQKEYIKNKNNGFIIIENEKYYFKKTLGNYHDLIIEKLAHIVGISISTYDLINIDGKFYYLNKDINSYGKFLIANEIDGIDNKLPNIKMTLEKLYFSKSPILMKKIIKIYLFDILTLSSERFNGNWGILYDNNSSPYDVWIFDNEYSFDDFNSVVLSAKLEMQDKLNSRVRLDAKDYQRENLEELEYFLAKYNDIFIEMFIDMYEKLTPDIVSHVFKQVEEEYNVKISSKDRDLYKYRINYKAIDELLVKTGIKEQISSLEDEHLYRLKHRVRILYKNNKKYYLKPVRNNLEPVLERLAKLALINCVHYERINLDGLDYYISEDIAGEDEFLTAFNIEFPNEDIRSNKSLKLIKNSMLEKNLYDIWTFLEQKYPDKIQFLMKEIVKIYLFDIITINGDRSLGNWGILFKNGEPDSVYILDNECSFNYEMESLISSKFDKSDTLKNRINFDFVDNPAIEGNIEDLEYFLATTSQEFKDILIDMFAKLNPEVVKQILEEEELKIGNGFKYEKEYLEDYTKNYELIRRLIYTRGLK